MRVASRCAAKLWGMTLRNLPVAFATLAFAAVAGAAGAVPAHASTPAYTDYGQIQLTVTHHGPIFTDNNGLGYDIVVTNNGPDAATGVVVRTTGFDCEANAQSQEACKPIPDENAGFIRTTTEVVRSDQYDTASSPGTCNNGWQPQADCMSDVVDLTK